MSSQPRTWGIAPLLFTSGFCALIYQTTWLREFRLIFGASTAATAAVLAIFMGGIGVGSALLGWRSEEKKRPLAFYAQLEMLIAAGAALSPVFLWLTREAYVGMGGTLAMGLFWGTLVRLVLATLAIGGPAFLMGGTLPAAVRAAIPAQDESRRSVALLYGVNTLGAVFGALAGTFYLFERWGNHVTLAFAVAINLCVVLVGFWLSRGFPEFISEPKESRPLAETTSQISPLFIYLAAGVSGFVFLLMEIVWYRMLGPLLGGSAFTFGLILAVALFGIGLGSVARALFGKKARPTVSAFAMICALEAVFIGLPYALGDRIALLTMLLRPLGALGFYGHVAAWTVICAVVVFPAAVVSGIQFPMLISMLGEGREKIASQTGLAYAWNTGGAIVGSLAGGFGMLPAFTAPGVWKIVVLLTCVLAALAAFVGAQQSSRRNLRLFAPLGLVGLALSFLVATGPTAFWRHSQIGVGRLTKFHGSKNEYQDLINFIRRDIIWETDGMESSVALSNSHSLNFVVNGRCDGNAQGDSGTQIMSGLVPAALHSLPKRAMVVGLGTGSTVGWLAAIPSMERVDAVELEPAIRKVAESCAAVNQKALQNPKVHVINADGREVLLTTREKYDIIASEPSNPYRAGIASLFTREYYQAAAGALNPGGYFAQWMQAYEVDVGTVATAYATLRSVFPHVDTWQTQEGDLLFVASAAPRTVDATALRQRLAQEPFKSALLDTWLVNDLEGFLAHFVADDSLARAMARLQKVPLNTDDRTILEFAFARNVDHHDDFRVQQLRDGAKASQCDRPALSNGEVNWKQVEQDRMGMLVSLDEIVRPEDYTDPSERSRAAAYACYTKGDCADALLHWREFPHESQNLIDDRMLAECLADEGKSEALTYLNKIKGALPDDAEAIYAHYLLQRGQFEEATGVLERLFHRLREDPFLGRDLTERTLLVAQKVAAHSKSSLLTLRLYQALRAPFAVYNNEEKRQTTVLRLGMWLDQRHYAEYTLPAIEGAEPHVPWQLDFLKVRKACYENMHSPLLARAERDLNRFVANQSMGVDSLVFMKDVPPDAPVEAGYATEKPAH